MNVLFLCTGNSCRSQMAEGFARHYGLEAASAGTEPAERVHPLAIRVMREKGIDLAPQRPTKLDRFLGDEWDVVITVCGDAEERCPVFPRAGHREHWPLPDPAKATGTEAEVLACFRHVRDQLEQRVRRLAASREKAGR